MEKEEITAKAGQDKKEETIVEKEQIKEENTPVLDIQAQEENEVKEKELAKQREVVLDFIGEKKDEKDIESDLREPIKNFAKERKLGKVKKGNIEQKEKFKIITNKARVGAVLKHVFLFCIASFFVVYSLFALVVVSLDIDNGVSRWLNNYMPVPALISFEGVVGYYEYKEASANNEENIEVRLVKEHILNNTEEELNNFKIWSLVD